MRHASSAQRAFAGVPIQFLGANAGVMFTGSTLLTGSEQEWRTTYDVNVLGVARTLRAFVPVMARQREHSVVEITASAAGVQFGGAGPYGTSKVSLAAATSLRRRPHPRCTLLTRH